MKLENIQGKLQSSFILLQFVHLSILCYTTMRHIRHVKYVLPADKYIDKVPDYSGFERKTTLRINPGQIPDLHWKLTNTYHTTNIGQTEIEPTSASIHDITVSTFKCVCKTSLSTETYTTQSRHEPLVCSVLPLI